MSLNGRRSARALASLACASLLFNLILLAASGIHRGGDTYKYVASADDLLSGRPFHFPGISLYGGYVTLVAASRAIGADLSGVIAAQFALAALATLTVYDLARQLSGRVAAVIAAVFFIIDVDIARWHTFVLTDSLYISLVTVTTWIVDRAVGRGAGGYIAAIAAVCVTLVIRPNGWIFVPLAPIYWIARTRLASATKYAAAAAIVIALGGAVSIAAFYRYGQVVGHVPRGWDNTFAFAQEIVNWFGIGEYREERGVRAVNRVAAEIAHVRGHYSTAHNAAVVALLAVVYPLAIAGFARRRRRPLSLLMLAVVAGHIAIVAVTFYDYDGRYLLYVFPLIVVFASCGVSDLVQRVRRSGGPIDYRGSPSTAPN